MTAIALGPVVCQGCGKFVYWLRGSWRAQTKRYAAYPGRRIGDRHRCRGAACGEVMPTFGERCARTPGHGYEHRSAYAMANARAARTGRGL